MFRDKEWVRDKKQVALLSKKLDLEKAEEMYCLYSHGDHVWDRRGKDFIRVDVKIQSNMAEINTAFME